MAPPFYEAWGSIEPSFFRLYKGIFPNGDPSTIADQFFRVYDVDQNEKVDFREFLCAVGIMTRGSEEERLKMLFKIYDQDGSGYISHEEYHNVVAVSSLCRSLGAEKGR